VFDNLLNVIKLIIEKYGETVLSEPRRVYSMFADLAREEPKAKKNAFIKCLECGFVPVLKNVAEPDRSLCKQRLAQKLHDEEGFDPELCGDTVELLAAVLFGEQQQKKNYCKKCGKELQEGWKVCPYCSVSAVKTSQVISSAISSGSGIWGYGIEQIKPETPVFINNKLDITAGCNECHYKENKNGLIKCDYYSCDISEAGEYDCGMKTSDPDYQLLRQKKKSKFVFWCFFQVSICIGSIILMFVFFPVGISLGCIGLVNNFIKEIMKEKRRKNAKRLSH
jgi:hypothetical protein